MRDHGKRYSRLNDTDSRREKLSVMSVHCHHAVTYLSAVCTAVLILACSAETSSFEGTVPSGLDLTGVWLLDGSRSDDPPDTEAAFREDRSASIEGKQANSAASIYFASQDFPVISSDRLEIEQDSTSIGILYGPGKHRDLVWGLQTKAAWQVDAGWENSQLVVKSSLSHTRGVERYELSADAETLVVEVSIVAGRDRESFTRTFVKKH